MFDNPIPDKTSDSSNARFLHELEALGKALSLSPKPLPPSPNPIPNPIPKSKSKKPSSSSSTSSFWSSWKPLKALSHLRHRRFDIQFTLHIHSIESLPAPLADVPLVVHWKRTTDPTHAATRPARPFHASIDFDETLAYRCSVYASRGTAPHKPAKYEPRQFLLWVSLANGRADLGRHMVDLTRLLPLTLEEFEEEDKQSGLWSTSFRLSGMARGATLNVSFGFSLIGEGSSKGSSRDSSGHGERMSEILDMSPGRVGGGLVRSRDRSRSVEDVKVLHEVLPSSRSELSSLDSALRELEYRKVSDGDVGRLGASSKPEFQIVAQQDKSPDLKSCTLLEPVKGNHEEDCDGSTEYLVYRDEFPYLKPCRLLEPVKGNEEDDCEESPGNLVRRGKSLDMKPSTLLEPVKGNEEDDCDESPGILVRRAKSLDMKPFTFLEPVKGNDEDGCDESPEILVRRGKSLYMKPSTLLELVRGNEEDGCDESPEILVRRGKSLDMKPCTLPELVKGKEEDDCDKMPEFLVIERGTEITTKDKLCDNMSEKADPYEVDMGGGGVVIQNEPSAKPDEQVEEFCCHDNGFRESILLPRDAGVEDFDSALSGLLTLKMEGMESPRTEAKTCKEHDLSEFERSFKPGSMMSRSRSLDDITESVASEFLSMLGIEHSPFGLSSESDPESPRERLWKQFEKDSLSTSGSIFGLDIGAAKDSGWGDFPEDLDLSSIVLEAETDLKAALDVGSKSRAKMLEDAETEALMRQWGLDEKDFHSSPPGSRSGFGSPIDLPPEEPLDRPPLGEGLGPFLKMKDGGFVRSMNPSHFKKARNKGSLIMQVSSPVVVPAEMGSGTVEILQCLASVGIEKLSVQAKKLMPLEDISGKTMQQAAWEATPTLEPYKRQEILQHPNIDVDSCIAQNTSRRKKKAKSLNQASSRDGEKGSEYVSLEDLAPLAMDKIEALSIEGLRIQSGMSDEEAPSNISPESVRDISVLEGKELKNSRSLGLEGAAGLQLLNVKDNGDDVDGLMGLSITLDEWMRLDSGIIDEDQISDRTSKILAAHHACSSDFVSGGWKENKRGGKKSGKRWGLLGNNFTVALMVQLRNPLRDYEPVGTPMLALIQVERVFVPPKPKIYSTVSEKGNNEQDDVPEIEVVPVAKEEKKEEGDVIPQFKITEVNVAGLKTEPGKKKVWGNPMQQQSGSRWLLASGMGKSNKHPFMKSKAVVRPSQVMSKVHPGDALWSISSAIDGTMDKWKELAALNPHVRNPNIILPKQAIRMR